jgi:hypothetical protein
MPENNKSCSQDMRTETRQVWNLLGIGSVVFLVMAISLWVSPYIFTEDTSALYRYALIKLPSIFLNIFALIAGLVLLDLTTDEDSLKCVFQDAMSTSILFSAFVIAMGLAIAFG